MNGFSRYAGQAWIPLWLAAALVAIFQTGFMPLYSTRTLGVAWEMWNSGQFLVPYANGAPYSHKVPLLFWLIHAGWLVGGVGDVSACCCRHSVSPACCFAIRRWSDD